MSTREIRVFGIHQERTEGKYSDYCILSLGYKVGMQQFKLNTLINIDSDNGGIATEDYETLASNDFKKTQPIFGQGSIREVEVPGGLTLKDGTVVKTARVFVNGESTLDAVLAKRGWVKENASDEVIAKMP